jgi:hypothetical protein
LAALVPHAGAARGEHAGGGNRCRRRAPSLLAAHQSSTGTSFEARPHHVRGLVRLCQLRITPIATGVELYQSVQGSPAACRRRRTFAEHPATSRVLESGILRRNQRGAAARLRIANTMTTGRALQLVALLFVPLSVGLAIAHASPTLVFITSCLAIVPLAGILGDATEQLTSRTSVTIGGLLNASFGNAAELIIGFLALRAGEIAIVKASITGSILGNLLAVLGLAMVAGVRNAPSRVSTGWPRRAASE